MRQIKFYKAVFLITLISLVLLLTGCGGGEIGTTYTSTHDEAKVLMTTGWTQLNQDDYSSSKATFQAALAKTTDAEQVAEANLGLGWAVAKKDGIKNASTYFDAAVPFFKDAKVSMAGYYLASADSENFTKGISLLESINMGNASTEYKGEFNLGFTTAKVHSLLGVLYYYTGQTSKANEQLSKAQSLITGKDNTDYTQVTEICDQLL